MRYTKDSYVSVYVCNQKAHVACNFNAAMLLFIYYESRTLCYALAVLVPRVGHTMDVLSPFISVVLIDSSTDSLVHVLMLSIQAVRGLPRLHAPGIVPCIISFSRQLPCFLMV